MHHWVVIVSLVAWIVTAIGTAPVHAEKGSGDELTFADLDKNSDKRLSQAEYVGRGGDSSVHQRDFHLFDLNRDGKLSRREFRSLATTAEGTRVGSIDDPFSEILQRAVAAMDDSYDGWQYRADETVDSTTFAINYLASISTDGRRRLDRVLILHADPDRDRKVTRDEAKRFLEIQLGIRWVNGQPLRLPNGLVFDFAEFALSDTDHDDELTQEEFVNHSWNSATADQDFERFDVDANGRITLSEYCRLGGPNLHDPIEAFRAADTNLDALLDADELKNATPSNRSYLVRSNLIAFDTDGDGHLSLNEYRVSMLANFTCPWENVPKDEDRDLHLSFEEFNFDSRNLFQLLRRFYFHRLDRDRDSKLSLDEFEFRTHKVFSLYRISVDGEYSREIYRHEDFPTCGSPAVSPDGRWILFDATPPEGANKSQILMMNSDGADVRDLCDGLMPSWSGDGSQFACSRYEGGSGVWIMNMDGTPQRRIDDGWGAQWSPDGTSIAYTNDNSIRIYDVATGKSRVVLKKGSHPYLYIYWNMAWSPDSRRLVFKGKLADKNEIVSINVTGEVNRKTLFSTTLEMGTDFAWSPDGRRILFSMHSREHQRSVIYQIDLESNDVPKIVPEANTAKEWTSLCFSPDGEWMVVATTN